MCGIIKPTQPIIPAIATADAVINVAPIMTNHFNRVTDTPSVLASSSDNDKMFKRQRSQYKRIISIKINGPPINKS